MALVILYDEAKENQIQRKLRGGGVSTPLFGSRDNPNLPLASLSQNDPGYFNGPHFHNVDQFQVVVDGAGKIGRHDLRPYSVHFSRAYTPYGPLMSNTGSGLTYVVMRAHPDTDSQRLPQELDQLKRAARQPWQITRPVTFPTPKSGALASDIMLQPVPEIADDKGLAVYTLRMEPNATAQAPDPTSGDGQYLMVVKGSLWHDNKERKSLALVFVWSKEKPYQIRAGPAGLEALVLNFPRPQTAATRTTASPQTTTGFKTWQCTLCSFVYDEAAGMPEEGIAAGTRWQDVPATWNCPDCSASKADFQMVELNKG